MRVMSRHGFVSFHPRSITDVVVFTDFFGIQLVSEDDYYTYPALKGLKRYSIKGSSFGGLTAVASYEGRHPWQVMKANGFVYSLALGKLVPKTTISTVVNPILVDEGFFVCQTPMLQSGSVNAVAQRILSFEGFFNRDFLELQLVSYSYE